MEIEKKYKLRSLPPPELMKSGSVIVQGYLITGCGEVRLRRKKNALFLTVKGDGTISREEWETEIPMWVYAQLWPLTEGMRIEKIRFVIPYQGLKLEIDVFEGALAGLFIMECEFPDMDTANSFVPPEWAKDAQDVTNNPAYKNKTLAVNGLPVEDTLA